MQISLTYKPTFPENCRTALLQLISATAQYNEVLRKILHSLPPAISSTETISSHYTCTLTAGIPTLQLLADRKEISGNSDFMPKGTWALVDMQNIHKGVQEKGWKINWKLFRQYLASRHNVVKAVVFMGYIKHNEPLYRYLREAGFITEFREVIQRSDGTIDGGNVDVDLAAYALNYKNDYDKAIIVADDADYCKMLELLNEQKKLKFVLSSHLLERSSKLIKKTVGTDSIMSIHSIRNLIERKIPE